MSEHRVGVQRGGAGVIAEVPAAPASMRIVPRIVREWPGASVPSRQITPRLTCLGLTLLVRPVSVRAAGGMSPTWTCPAARSSCWSRSPSRRRGAHAGDARARLTMRSEPAARPRPGLPAQARSAEASGWGRFRGRVRRSRRLRRNRRNRRVGSLVLVDATHRAPACRLILTCSPLITTAFAGVHVIPTSSQPSGTSSLTW